MNLWLQRALDAINQATEGMDRAALERHPEGKWCASEVLEHLSIAFGSTVKVMHRCLRHGKPLGSKPSLKQRMVAFLVADVGYFPEGRKSPTLVLPTGADCELVSRDIRDNLIAMDAAITECVAKFGENVILADHPVIGPMTAKQWRRFHYVHTRHHMKQIARLRTSPATASARTTAP